MKKFFVGVITASIESPKSLDSKGRELYANAFLCALENKFNRTIDGFKVDFHLISAEKGCIKLKAAVFISVLVGSGVSGLLLLENPDVFGLTKFLAHEVQNELTCKVNDKPWACKLLKCTTSLSTKYHYTKEGDTLENVLRNSFNTKEGDVVAATGRMKKWYPDALVNPSSTKLKPGYFLANLDPGSCIEAESIRASAIR